MAFSSNLVGVIFAILFGTGVVSFYNRDWAFGSIMMLISLVYLVFVIRHYRRK